MKRKRKAGSSQNGITKGGLREDVALYAGGITFVSDDDYHIDEKTGEALSPKKKSLTRNRNIEIKKVIKDSIETLRGDKKQFPSAKEIWQYLKNNYDNIDCIQEVTSSTIHWQDDRGGTHDLSYRTFQNTVSKFKTGREK